MLYKIGNSKIHTYLKSIGACTIFFITVMAIFNVIEKNINNNESFEVIATPISGKVIILDAGHGIPDEGAVGFYGTSEQKINLKITLNLQKLIEQSGAKVVLTRSDENGIYSLDSKSIKNKKVSDIKKRVEIGNESDGDILVSIHLNKFPMSSLYSGWQTFYQKGNKKSEEIANCIQQNLNKNIQKENNRKIMPITNIYLMEHVKIPSVIVECGFLSNEEETKKLLDADYQSKLAWGIYMGLQDYFSREINNDR